MGLISSISALPMRMYLTSPAHALSAWTLSSGFFHLVKTRSAHMEVLVQGHGRWLDMAQILRRESGRHNPELCSVDCEDVCLLVAFLRALHVVACLGLAQKLGYFLSKTLWLKFFWLPGMSNLSAHISSFSLYPSLETCRDKIFYLNLPQKLPGACLWSWIGP